MKILHVVPTYLPARRYGGPIVSVHGLCSALADRGHEVTVFTTNVDGDSISDVPLDREVRLDGVRIRYFEVVFRRLYVSPGMAEALQRVDHFDIVHNHSVFLWPTAAAARRARAANVPYVISPRGMLVQELIQRRNAILKRAWIRLIERQNFNHADAVHFTSQQELSDATTLGVPVRKPVVIPNGIALSPKPSIQRDERTIVYLGRISWKKNLDGLIRAMLSVPDARLIIAGNDEEGLTQNLSTLTETLGLTGRVTFVGPRYGEAKWELLARATALVLPSMSENFGNVILEAMLMETPTVVSPAVGIGETLEPAEVTLRTNDFAAAINRLLSDRPFATDLARRARAFLETHYAWPIIAEQMESAYQCSIASHRSS